MKNKMTLKRSSVWNKAASSGGVADECTSALKTQKSERPSLQSMFCLSILGYCKNMALQNGRLHKR